MSKYEHILATYGYLAIGDSKADAVRRVKRALPALSLREAIEVVDIVRGRVAMEKLDFFHSVR